jgi:hypothetical protein
MSKQIVKTGARTFIQAPFLKSGGQDILRKMWLFSVLLFQFDIAGTQSKITKEMKSEGLYVVPEKTVFLEKMIDQIQSWLINHLKNILVSSDKLQDSSPNVLGIGDALETINNVAIKNLTEAMNQADITKIKEVPAEVWLANDDDNIPLENNQLQTTDVDFALAASLALSSGDPEVIQEFVRNCDPIYARSLSLRTTMGLACLQESVEEVVPK